jgi:phage tail-like protein
MAEASVLDPASAFRFEVQARNANMGFSKVSGLREEQDVIEYREGTDPIQHRKIPGLRTFPNLVCERGIGPGTELIAWRQAVILAQDFRATVTVRVKNCDNTLARVLTFEKAWPMALEMSDLDASSSEVSIESLEIAHEGRVDKVIASTT